MVRLLAIVTLLALAINQSLSQCISHQDGYNQFDISQCALNSINNQPPIIEHSNEWIPVTVDDGVSPRFQTNYSLFIYGVEHNSFFLNTNGATFWGSTTSTAGTLRLPLSSSYGDYLPVLAPAWTDQFYLAGVSKIYYGESGDPGRRTFIIRYQDMMSYPTRVTNPNIRLSYDIIFFEDRPGDMEWRYYRVDVVSQISYKISVGLHGWSTAGPNWVLYTDTQDWPNIGPALHNTVLTFRYIGTTASTEPCGGLGYDLSTIRGQQLNLTTGGFTYLYSVCGIVADERCSSNPATAQSMICRVSPVGAIDLGVFGPRSSSWQYPTDGSQTGVESVIQSGTYCPQISAQQFSTVKFVCDATATTPELIAASTPFTCVNQLTVKTSLVCSGGSRGNDTEELFPRSILNRCNTVEGASYRASLCPRPVEERRPITLTGETQIFNNGVSVRAVVAPLGFSLPFYGLSFTNVYISVQGSLFFGTTSTSTPAAPPSYGFSSVTQFPAIFAFGTQLSTLTYSGISPAKVTYTTMTIDGQQTFIVRYWNMKYTAYRGLVDMVVDFDVMLTQTGDVFVKYYVVTPNNDVRVTIGMHGPSSLDIYTGYHNYEFMNALAAGQLQGATLNFSYSGKSVVDACAAFGVDFSGAFTQDLQYQDVANLKTFYLNPCGIVRTQSPCGPNVAACEVIGSTALTLSTFNPAAIMWSKSPAPLTGIRSSLRDGQWCTAGSQPRTVHIDWLCVKGDSSTRLVSMTETGTCTWNAVIYTPIACESTNVCTTFTSRYYTGNLCPSVVPAITQTSPVSILQNGDDNSQRVEIPIRFHLYGQQYRHVYISVNGQLSFGPSPLQTPYGELPLQASSLDMTPVLVPWWTDFVMRESSRILYSTETINGERAFVIRYEFMEYYQSETAGTADTASFDVLLFDGVEGKVEVRYFAMKNPTNQPFITIGIQGDDVDNDELIVIASRRAMDAAFAASFTRSTLRYIYSGPDASTVLCGGLGYNFTEIAGTELRFTDGAYRYAMSICGITTDHDCQADVKTDRAMLCRRASTQLTGFASLAEWNPAASFWHYPRASETGVQLVAPGQYCSSGRQFTTVFNFICSETATSPTFSAASVDTCTAQANITTHLACGEGDRYAPKEPVQSTLTSCLSINGLNYNAALCPRSLGNEFAFPEFMENPQYILDGVGGADDGSHVINLGFDFYFYDRLETSVAVSTNGLLSLGYVPVATSFNGPFPNIGLTADNFPVIAALFTDFMNEDTTSGVIPYSGFIAYSHAGVAPNRRVIIRFQDVDYYRSQNSLEEQSASFDIVLTEGNPGGIEIRYYLVESVVHDQQKDVVGLVGYNQTHTAVANHVHITRNWAAQMTGTTLRYTWTGVSQPNVCRDFYNMFY